LTYVTLVADGIKKGLKRGDSKYAVRKTQGAKKRTKLKKGPFRRKGGMGQIDCVNRKGYGVRRRAEKMERPRKNT